MPRKERPLRLFFVVMKVFLDRELGLRDEKLARLLFQHALCHFQDRPGAGKFDPEPAPALDGIGPVRVDRHGLFPHGHVELHALVYPLACFLASEIVILYPQNCM